MVIEQYITLIVSLIGRIEHALDTNSGHNSMIGTSPIEYAWVVGWAILLHSIGPICTFCSITAVFLPPSWHFSGPSRYYIYSETIFYVSTYGYRKYYLQRPASHPQPPGKHEREELFRRCFNSSTDVSTTLSRWFLGAPIEELKRDNITEWIQWAFFNTDANDPLFEDEVDSYVMQLESRLGMHFLPGRADIRCIRLTMDKVDTLHRSLTWYTSILVVDVLTHLYLTYHNFHFHRGSFRHTALILPPRPQALIASSLSPSNNLSYWHHPHTSRKELPILFLHGIGVGLYPYMEFLKEINQDRPAENGDIGVLAIEILAISSRITSVALRRQAMCDQIRSILRYHGFKKFVLMSHSYGSVISTHLLKTPDIASRIASIVLVDPVTILLHQPDIVYNFTVRRPTHANEWLLWYFGSKDMGVAHTLARTFFWSENILWKEDLLNHHSTVFLCEMDSIVNAPAIREYMLGNAHVGVTADDGGSDQLQGLERLKGESESNSITTVWCTGLDHGGAFDVAEWRATMKSTIGGEVR